MHLWACTNVYSSKIHTKPPWTLAHPLTLANPASEITGPSSHLLSPVDCPVLSCSLLSSSLDSGTFLPSSSSDLVGNLPRNPFVWVLRQNRLREPLTGTHLNPHPHPNPYNECPTSCHKFHTLNNKKKKNVLKWPITKWWTIKYFGLWIHLFSSPCEDNPLKTFDRRVFINQ